jgi:hypothetical protein
MTYARSHALPLLVAAACAALLLLLFLSTVPHQAIAQNDGERNDAGSVAKQGFAISPVPLKIVGKNPALVGLGSYIVNAQGGCNDCHTWPNYAPGGDPFLGQPEQINTNGYMAGGRPFGPLISPNITPFKDGRPAGLTLFQFINVMRTGHDPDDPEELLQVMPWPVYRNMTNRDLAAVYAYLNAIPPIK